ncbi:MAG: ATP synthase F0 subunit B [Acidobacteriota bacterium]|nr:ATP synthase F0 subunit B [Acidobacteriota bacterium]
MKNISFRRLTSSFALVVFLSCLFLGSVRAQEATQAKPEHGDSAEAPQAKPEHGDAAAEPAGEGPNAGVGEILAKTTETAASRAETWGRKLGIGPDVSFAISLALNFAGIAVIFYLLLRSRLPQAFRERTAAIQKGIREAEAASADAARRLSEIEARLAKLDSEVADIRTAAESEAAAEEQRIREAAEDDKRKVVQGAEAEIAAVARNARRELKSYAASLAVDLATRQIRVDEPTDQSLVREFVDQLGKDGK